MLATLTTAILAAAKVVWPVPPLAIGSVPVTPVVSGKPVRLVATPDAGVPSAGVTKVGELANTNAPVPVSSVTALAKFALDGVPKNVATPVPNEVIPVPPLATGSAVPDKVIANVPLLVIGEPATDKNVGTVAATLVTVPELPLAATV